MTLTPKLLADLRDAAEEHIRLGGYASGDAWIEQCPPATILALLDRIKELEEGVEIRDDAAIERGEHDD